MDEELFIVRCRTVDLEEEALWQTKTAWDLGPREQALANAIAERIIPARRETVRQEITSHGLRGEFHLAWELGEMGTLEVTCINAAGALAGRYLAVSHVLAAYGAGTMLGEVLASRLQHPPRTLAIRWGALVGGIAADGAGGGRLSRRSGNRRGRRPAVAAHLGTVRPWRTWTSAS
jgi:hypothetical protein